jgi:predicted MFS family arabinose efflux permease
MAPMLGALVGGVFATSIGLRLTLAIAAAVATVAFVRLLCSPARQLRVLPVPHGRTPALVEPDPVVA